MYKSTLLLALAQLVLSAPAVPRQDPCAAQGPGVCIQNRMGYDNDFFFFRNQADGNGWAIPTYEPDRAPIRVAAGQSHFEPLDVAWKGRIQRANAYPSTWVEMQTAADDGQAWGDISFIQGFDGAAQIGRMDSAVVCGLDRDLVNGAPENTVITRADGRRTLANTEFSPILFIDGNIATRDYIESQIGMNPPMAGYTRNDSPACVASDPSQQLRVTFF